MPALGNCALKNAIISIASKVWTTVLMNWRQNFVLVEITKRTWRSSRLVSYLLFKVTQKVLSFPSISIFASVKKPFCLNRSIDPNTRRELCTINMTGTFTRWLVICWTAASRTIKNWMLARNTSCHVSFTLQPRELRTCYKIAKLAGSISEAINLLSVKFLLVANDVLFRLPFAKVEEMEKTFRDIVISVADILSFRDCLESDLKRKNMWEHLKSGKLHTILCSWNNCVTVFLHTVHRLVGIPW